METTTVKLEPIVNGSFNHELTNEQMLEFPFESKKQMAWNLIVSMQFAHSFKNVDHKVFNPVVAQKYTHDMLTPDCIDDVLVTVRTQYQQKHKDLLRLTADLYYKQGAEIYRQQKELGFGGFLKMDGRKMIGYIQAGGSWNEYNHIDIASAVQELEQLVPKVYYNPNNPNNGNKMHEWTTTGEYLTMVFNYLSKKDHDRCMEFYNKHFQPIGRRIKADSVRFELTEHPNDHYALEFVMWWD